MDTTGIGDGSSAAAGGAAIPADTEQPTSNGTGTARSARASAPATGDEARGNTIRLTNEPADNPDADNDDSEGEAFIAKGRKDHEKKLLDDRKAAGMSADEAKESLRATRGESSDDKPKRGRKKAK